MALDPESQRLIDLMAAANRPAWNTLSPQAARDLYLSLRPASQGPRPAEAKVVDRTIPGPAGDLAVRIYRPASAPADAKLPCLVYAHGGGWVFGNLDSHDVLCAQFALEAGIVVFAIDYRLAPEARFPGAFDDVVAGLKWVAANGASIGVDSIEARHRRRQRRRQPRCGGRDLGTRQWRTQAPPAASRLSGDRRRRPRRVLSPLRGRLWAECRHHGMVLRPLHAGQGGPRRLAHLAACAPSRSAGLPPALVITAGYDPLRDEGRAYAFRLHQEGTQADLVEFGGMLHGFLSSPMLLHGARRGTSLAAAALREALVQRAQ